MTFWIGLWKFCLIAGIIAFAIMAIFVSIGGARDIRRLLQKLRDSSRDEQPSGNPSEPTNRHDNAAESDAS